MKEKIAAAGASITLNEIETMYKKLIRRFELCIAANDHHIEHRISHLCPLKSF